MSSPGIVPNPEIKSYTLAETVAIRWMLAPSVAGGDMTEIWAAREEAQRTYGGTLRQIEAIGSWLKIRATKILKARGVEIGEDDSGVQALIGAAAASYRLGTSDISVASWLGEKLEVSAGSAKAVLQRMFTAINTKKTATQKPGPAASHTVPGTDEHNPAAADLTSSRLSLETRLEVMLAELRSVYRKHTFQIENPKRKEYLQVNPEIFELVAKLHTKLVCANLDPESRKLLGRMIRYGAIEQTGMREGAMPRFAPYVLARLLLLGHVHMISMPREMQLVVPDPLVRAHVLYLALEKLWGMPERSRPSGELEKIEEALNCAFHEAMSGSYPPKNIKANR